MKKVLSIVAVAALATLYSCGGAAESTPNEVDSAAAVVAAPEEQPEAQTAGDASAAEAATAAEAPAH